MPTKDGKEPTNSEMLKDLSELNNKINSIIQEFKDIYNEPAIILSQEIIDNKYRCNLNIDGVLLRKQYGNFSDDEYNLTAQNE